LKAVPALLADSDVQVARRALWLLPWLKPPPLPPDLIAAAQEVVLRIADVPSLEHPVTGYLRALTQTLWTNDFPATLYEPMVSDPESPAPHRLISCSSGEVPPAYRPTAQAWLLRAIDHGRETAWIERLAANAGDDALEAELRARMEGPDDNIRQYAQWALRAMGRLKG